jgi:hypothetical protein
VSFGQAEGERTFGICRRLVLPDVRRSGRQPMFFGRRRRSSREHAPIKSGFTTVELPMLKDDDKRPTSDQER